MTVTVTMRDMLEAGVHFGHQTRYWNPKMAPYIYGSRHNIHIINLEESLPMFRQALHFIHGVASRRGKILFVGTKHAAREVVREEALRAGMPYIDYRWLGGMLTNYKTIRQSIKRLKDLEERLANEELLASMTKKEVLNLMRAKDKLHTNLSGIKHMGGLPDVLFVIDVGIEKIAIQEAIRLGIPVVGIADTNADPAGVDYLIPGNDDAVRAIRFYCKMIASSIIDARGATDLVEIKSMGGDGEAVDRETPKKKVVTKKKAKKTKKTVDGETTENSVTLSPKKPAAKKSVNQQAVSPKVEKNVGDVESQ